MEANEAQELQEHAEHGAHESGLRPVAFTMSLLAVLVAVTTVLGHRTHTEAVLNQNRATDQWNEYQAKKIRAYNTQLTVDLLTVIAPANQDAKASKDAAKAKAAAKSAAKDPSRDAAARIAKSYADHQAKWTDELKDQQEKAEALEKKVEQAEARADRYDLAEALLEIGLVITSVTLLTKQRLYWFFGMAFSAGGIVSAIVGLLR